MSEMIERAAKAAWEAQRKRLDDIDLKPWDEELPGLREDWRMFIRDGLAAMREPTEAMLLNRYGAESGFEGPSVHEAKLTWRFMIDAALKEP